MDKIKEIIINLLNGNPQKFKEKDLKIKLILMNLWGLMAL